MILLKRTNDTIEQLNKKKKVEIKSREKAITVATVRIDQTGFFEHIGTFLLDDRYWNFRFIKTVI